MASRDAEGAPVVRAGEAAWVAVAVAGAWRSPDAPRELDRPAIAQPPDVPAWLAGMDDAQKRGLVGRLDTQALLGEPVAVAGVRGDWAHVRLPLQRAPRDGERSASDGYEAWIPVAQLDAGAPGGADRVDLAATVIAPRARLELPGGLKLEVSFGTSLPALAAGPERIEVGLPGGRSGVLAARDAALHKPGRPALQATAASVVGVMRSFLGLPYLWAGTSGFGFDCSGLVHLVHRVHGIELPRDTGPQSEVGTLVEPGDRRPGDLLFFERGGDVHHVVTWLGEGRVIESPKTGLAVRDIAFDDLPYAHEVTVTRRVLAATPA